MPEAPTVTKNCPKRILALDGGGVKGVVSLAFLERIESELRQRHGDDFRLCDYFDLIAGTSTGAIIAALLAQGSRVQEVINLYEELGTRVFAERRSWKLPWTWGALTRARFGKVGLTNLLKNEFGDIRLSSNRILTGLCIVIRRADNGRTWLLTNREAHKRARRNELIPLWQAVCASAAAPGFFEPELMEFPWVENRPSAAFIDGGISASNNPALAVFLLSVMKTGEFKWSTGEDELLLVSIGTGSWARASEPMKVMDSRVWNWAIEVPSLLMEDIDLQNQLVLQFLSDSPTARWLDIKFETLKGELLCPTPLLSYLRYDVDMSIDYFERLGMELDPDWLVELKDMSNAENIRHLLGLSRIAARDKVKNEHFSDSFDKGIEVKIVPDKEEDITSEED
jgi:uncharacterized protein